VRQLHFVGFTPDHEGLVFAARKGAASGSYVVTLDANLLEQLDIARRQQLSRGYYYRPQHDVRNRAESALSPREMQARLRAGRTVEEVAAEAGVDVEWVNRFAAPIFAEQARAIDRAGRVKLRATRRLESDRPLRAAVLRNLADRGVQMLDAEMDAAWSAFQLAGPEWVIRFRAHQDGRDLEAEWTYDMSAESLVARDPLAAELGFVDPVPDRPRPGGRATPKRSAGRTSAEGADPRLDERLDHDEAQPEAGSGARATNGPQAGARPVRRPPAGGSVVSRAGNESTASPATGRSTTSPAGSGSTANPAAGRSISAQSAGEDATGEDAAGAGPGEQPAIPASRSSARRRPRPPAGFAPAGNSDGPDRPG
jgi:hypothetical protein